jgi:hypothetical protein
LRLELFWSSHLPFVKSSRLGQILI